MRLFGTVNSAIDGKDRAAYLTPPFDRALMSPAPPPPMVGDDANGVELQPQVKQPVRHESGEGAL